MIRLNKYLANAGVVSRRNVKELIDKGLVTINGEKATESGLRIDPENDQITVNGESIKKSSNWVYIILNKPLDVVSTTSDEMGRTSVTDLVESKVRLYPVGRLDSDSIGLILLTNDGELTHKLTHPKFHIPKTYQVMIKDKVTEFQLSQLRSGMQLKEGMTLPAEVKVVEEYKFSTKLEFVLNEGKNRQIRRMCARVGMEVLELKRISLGPIKLADLAEGKYRDLSEEEVKELKKSVVAGS